MSYIGTWVERLIERATPDGASARGSANGQLSLDLGFGLLPTVLPLIGDDETHGCLTVLQSEAGVSIDFQAPAAPSHDFAFKLRLRPPVMVDLPAIDGHLGFILPEQPGDSNSARRAIGPLMRHLADAQLEVLGRCDRPALERLAVRLLQAARHLGSLCDLAALRAAQVFPRYSKMRWSTYAAAAADTSERVAQMAEVCPGVLLACEALRGAGHSARAEEIIGRVVQGAKLGSVLDLAVDATLAATPRYSGQLDQDRRTVARTQRMRVYRAGPLVAPCRLISPFAMGLAAEDIPQEPEENARWYEVTSQERLWPRRPTLPCSRDADEALMVRVWARGGRFDLGRRYGLKVEQQHGLGALISRQSRQVVEWAADDEGGGYAFPHATKVIRFELMLAEVMDYLRFTGRCPGRATSLERLVSDSQHWHENAPWELFFHDLDQELVFPGGVWPKWRSNGGLVTPLTTVRDLVGESMRMRHCIASYADSACAGEVQVFHAEINGKALTVMAELWPSGVEILEVSGRANREVTKNERAVLARWRLEMYQMLRSRAEPD
jgi:hypothetical protein